MPTVEPFTRNMIEKYLRSRKLKFLTDQDGDYMVHFAYDPATDCEITAHFMAQGSSSQIYMIAVSSTKYLSQDQWPLALLVCNTWNKEWRWPKAYLNTQDPENDTHASIRLEEQLDLEQGIHQELFDDFSDTVLTSVGKFWNWAHSEQNL